MVPGSHRILLLSPANVGGKRAQMLPQLLASKTSNQILVVIFPDWPPETPYARKSSLRISHPNFARAILMKV